MMEIVMIIVVIGGAILLWPHIQGTANGQAVQTSTNGGQAQASDGSGMANGDQIRARTKRMIAEITARARRGGGIRQRNSGGSGSNISIEGTGATVCVNGKCTSRFSGII